MSPADRHAGGSRADVYRDWDAAYVLGSLSPAERLEYEEHLARCPECAALLAELAGMPSLLASLSADEAFAIDAAIDAAIDGAVGSGHNATGEAVDAPPTLLPTLLSRARSARRRSRLISVGVGVGSVAAAVALTLVVALAIWPVGGAGSAGVSAPTSSAVASPGTSPGASPGTSAPNDASLASQLQFVPQVPGPLSAEATLQDEPWGTRIEWKCTWAAGDGTPGAVPPTAPPSGYHDGPPPSGAPASGSAATGADSGAVGYGMIVTDRNGASIQVATWTSDPGTVATPTATTSIRLADIASVAIVAADSGQVLLKSTL
ncbi:anti-sigma factor family protein [Subtercola endophyticus]|uniref:anti-sigma factor family protein n=1 Tax=Subtercola endophyticus TaxID=2895559 RepID=UPI001E64F773|nr:zf-HC2 domain-containing protein [Subtercola endophyticus]UFS59014.1 zf-HC2 domain-containing protein [Subtercola endophyticus]